MQLENSTSITDNEEVAEGQEKLRKHMHRRLVAGWKLHSYSTTSYPYSERNFHGVNIIHNFIWQKD